MMFITLRFLATGCFLQVVGDFIGVDKSTVNRVVEMVTRAIATLSRRFIDMPRSEEEINKQWAFDVKQRVEAIVLACAVLHNIACLMKDTNPPLNEDIEAAVDIVFPDDAIDNKMWQ
ncbi:hypothetical protein QE152_g34327 [Popillia japonica]|uniref:Nuclease HARBI1 n=1 Tax=Popillia japonica TaxID=7064 RepID=A0AAW1IU62_POPJA